MSLPSLPQRSRLFWLAAGFFVLAAAIYGLSLWNDFVRLDDGLLIYENPVIRTISFHSLWQIFTMFDPELYIPLTFFNYQLLYQLGGQNAFVYHLWLLMLHTGNALLFTWFVYLVSKKNVAAIAAGLIFLVHPLNTEAVAWASALKDQLSTIFFLGSVIAYLYSHESHDRKMYYWSIALFALGLLSKVMVVTLPVVLILVDDLRGRAWWKKSALFEKIPHFALSVVFGLVAILGKTAVLSTTTPLQTVLMATKSALFYLYKIFVPMNFSVLYTQVGEITLHRPEFLFTSIGLVLLVAFALISRRWTKWFSFGIGMYLLTLVPTFTNFSKGGDLFFASDRYVYLPSMGILLLLGLLAAAVWDTFHARWQQIGLQVAGILVLAFLSFQAHAQSLVWKDTETLFTHVIAVYPEAAASAYNNLANAYRRQGRLDEAVSEFEKALGVRDHARIRSNLGATLVKLGRMKEAEDQFHKAMQLDPGDAEPWFGLGILYATLGETNKALTAYERAIDLNPKYVAAYTNRGSYLLEIGRVSDAKADFEKAIAIDNYFAQAHQNLGVLELQQGDNDAALKELQIAADLQPRLLDAHVNLAVVYAKLAHLPEARRELEIVLELDPGNSFATTSIERIDATLKRAGH